MSLRGAQRHGNLIQRNINTWYFSWDCHATLAMTTEERDCRALQTRNDTRGKRLPRPSSSQWQQKKGLPRFARNDNLKISIAFFIEENKIDNWDTGLNWIIFNAALNFLFSPPELKLFFIRWTFFKKIRYWLWRLSPETQGGNDEVQSTLPDDTLS